LTRLFIAAQKATESAILPSPLVGEGGFAKAKPGEGYLSADSPAEITPHPALRATFSHKGRRNKKQELHNGNQV
jgi:hypothetical protein